MNKLFGCWFVRKKKGGALVGNGENESTTQTRGQIHPVSNLKHQQGPVEKFLLAQDDGNPSHLTLKDMGKVKSVLMRTANLQDLAEEEKVVDEKRAAKFCKPHTELTKAEEEVILGKKQTSYTKMKVFDPVKIIRSQLPEDPLLNTPFGTRRMTYCDYTASGRSLHFVETYIKRVVMPMYANTHTETSATGLQTTLSREDARSIIMTSLHANTTEHDLIFAGSGSTGAIWKLIAMLGIHCPMQLRPYLKTELIKKPLVLVSQAEHHSNELMWRETIADVLRIPFDTCGSLDLNVLEHILKEKKDQYDLIIGSFTAGSNVTGLTTGPGPVASMMHKYGGRVCFDYAGAGPYKEMNMSPTILNDALSYLDAIFISPHKFVGGPGTPGLLCLRKDFADVRQASKFPPTIAGGGTVTLVVPDNEEPDAGTIIDYEEPFHVREEAGTPAVVESIRCGLVFHVRDLVGAKRIEELESRFAVEAVKRMKAKGIWVMGDVFSNITSPDRLSITSFNIFCKLPNPTSGKLENVLHPNTGRPLLLHYHFVAALLNDLYGIQARSGCACAGPLSFLIWRKMFPQDTEAAHGSNDLYEFRPGFTRVNFNYFIEEEEFDYILSAIEQIAENGWKLLPLYALCIKTGQYWFNGLCKDEETGELVSFNRWDAVRRLNELEFSNGGSVAWKEPRCSKEDRTAYLAEALKVYEDAPKLVKRMLFRFRDLRRKNVEFPQEMEPHRFFVLGSEILGKLGISKEDRSRESSSQFALSSELNPDIVSMPENYPGGYRLTRPKG